MTALDEGVLLLCCQLGNRDCRPLTTHQFQTLGCRVRADHPTGDPFRSLTFSDLEALGYSWEEADRILSLLNREAQLHRYLAQGQDQLPMTCLDAGYPQRLTRLLGHRRPTALFYRGDPALLNYPAIAVVGSRQLLPDNEAFARQAGRQAAEEGFVLVSGGAKGADSVAQQACLEAGGQCVIFVADQLSRHRPQERVVYVSVGGYDLPFSTHQALNRNVLIHALGRLVLAAQCTYGRGGTWQGCQENLKHRWSPLFVFQDGSQGANALVEQGATGIDRFHKIRDLRPSQLSFF